MESESSGAKKKLSTDESNEQKIRWKKTKEARKFGALFNSIQIEYVDPVCRCE